MSSHNRQPYQWDKPRWVLHFAFASCILLQLLSSQLMRRPYPGRVLDFWQSAFFSIHRYAGLVATLLVLIYWIWILWRRPSLLNHLFPWFSSENRHAIFDDCHKLMRLQLPDATFSGGLPGLVQGLGLLLVTATGVLGTLLFMLLPNSQVVPPLVQLIKESHGLLAYWIWWYVSGHTGMAVTHYLYQLYSRKRG